MVEEVEEEGEVEVAVEGLLARLLTRLHQGEEGVEWWRW